LGRARKRLFGFVTVWLVTAWGASFACAPAPVAGDAGDATSKDAGCTSAFGCADATDAFVFYDPCGDASLALRARATFDQTCSGGPERGCHLEMAGNTTLTLDDASFDYAMYGLIGIPSSEMPDVLRVAPYDPDHSYLDWKVCGDPRRAAGTGIMPLTNALDSDSGAVVPCICNLMHDWIEAGAP
jgi:hypothetical protein